MAATTTNGGVSWLDVIDRNLQGWLTYLNRPRDPIVANATPYGQPSQSDVQLAALNAQLQAQQQNQKMLLLAGGAAVVLYLLSR